VAYEGSRPIAYGAEALEYTNTEGYYVAKWFKVSIRALGQTIRGVACEPARSDNFPFYLL
jgi:hypothetical protein